MNQKLLDYFNGDELAASVWAGKYQLTHQGQILEETPDDMHQRLAKEFARIEAKYIKNEIRDERLSKYGQERLDLTTDRIFNYFKDFKYIIPQGSVMAIIGNSHIVGSASNCYVINGPDDSYGGICRADEEMVQLMKRRAGVGLDLSKLRPNNAPVKNVAKTSTGMASFMHRYSNSTREVAQSGRRGALMLSVHVEHPDVLDFALMKQDLSKVTGANVSVLLSSAFMDAVNNNTDYILRFPIDYNYTDQDIQGLDYNTLKEVSENIFVKKIKAREYWNQFIHCAWKSAEPGLLFYDNAINNSPDGVYPQFKFGTTNPCGEQYLQPYDSCRLIAMNLLSFVKNPFTEDAEFDFDKLYEVSYEQLRLGDALVDLELECVDNILAKIENDPEEEENKYRERLLWEKIKTQVKNGRRIGSGITALGDMLAALGHKYDSPTALSIIDDIFYTKMKAELDATIDLAILRDTFIGCDVNKEYSNGKGNNNFYEDVKEAFPDQYDRMTKYGRRNISWSTVAPTGSVSILTQTTSGIEPLFMAFYTRRKKINPDSKDVRIDFTDQNGDTWQEYFVFHPQFKRYLEINGVNTSNLDGSDENKERIQKYFENSPWYNATANDIDWIKRVEIQAIITKYTTNAISSTINLPNHVTESKVSDIYLNAAQRGLKGITVYRDGCRTGVLVSSDSKSSMSSIEFTYRDAPKRPSELPCKLHKITVGGEKFVVLVGFLEEKPYEVFAFRLEDREETLVSGEGILKKVKSGYYNLVQKDNTIINITDTLTDKEEIVTKLTSLALRHGTDVKFIGEILSKTKGHIGSFEKAIARTLRKYIKNGAKANKNPFDCKDCNGENVIYEEGCIKCSECGKSKC
jgi:ribonucleoside-diphosphate reductase alpha chain